MNTFPGFLYLVFKKWTVRPWELLYFIYTFKCKVLYTFKISIIVFVCRHIFFSTFVFLIFSLHIFKKLQFQAFS